MQTASSEVVRDINRRIVLNLIRTRQPISRADLARASGMQRSTISLIVEELVEERWVLEGPTGRLPRGRRPTFLRLNDERVIIGVDIRPTQITVALADVNGKFTSQTVMDTPSDPEVAIKSIIQRIQAIVRTCEKKKIEGIGISLPGRFHQDTNRLEICRNLVVVTVSEGIGTGILLNGQLARGLNGMAGEFGHVPLDLDGPLCSCGSRGCWEVFASNRAALRYYLESSTLGDGLGFQDLLSLADQGDARAVKALDTMAHYLGRGMRMIVAGLAPEKIVVIGELTRSWHRFGPVIEAEVKAQVLPGGGVPVVVPEHEDGLARLRGTVALMLQKHFGTGATLAS